MTAAPHEAESRAQFNGEPQLDIEKPKPRKVPWSKRLTGPALLVPALLAMIGALAYPLITQFIRSFQSYGLAQEFGNPPDWVGFDNYVRLLTDPYVWQVILRSIAFCLVNAGLTMVAGITLALLMARVGKAARLTLQVGLLLAWGTPVLATMTVWKWLFNTQYGVVNWVLVNVFRLEQFNQHSWIIEPMSFYVVATIIIVWMSTPFVVFTVYAGLLQVSSETIEAAQIDGANAWQRFWKITIPIVKPVLFVVMLLQVIWDLRVFTQIHTLQRAGAPTRETHLLGTLIYSKLGNLGEAGALATIMLVLTLLLTVYYVRRMLKEEQL